MEEYISGVLFLLLWMVAGSVNQSLRGGRGHLLFIHRALAVVSLGALGVSTVCGIAWLGCSTFFLMKPLFAHGPLMVAHCPNPGMLPALGVAALGAAYQVIVSWRTVHNLSKNAALRVARGMRAAATASVHGAPPALTLCYIVYGGAVPLMHLFLGATGVAAVAATASTACISCGIFFFFFVEVLVPHCPSVVAHWRNPVALAALEVASQAVLWWRETFNATNVHAAMRVATCAGKVAIFGCKFCCKFGCAAVFYFLANVVLLPLMRAWQSVYWWGCKLFPDLTALLFYACGGFPVYAEAFLAAVVLYAIRRYLAALVCLVAVNTPSLRLLEEVCKLAGKAFRGLLCLYIRVVCQTRHGRDAEASVELLLARWMDGDVSAVSTLGYTMWLVAHEASLLCGDVLRGAPGRKITSMFLVDQDGKSHTVRKVPLHASCAWLGKEVESRFGRPARTLRHNGKNLPEDATRLCDLGIGNDSKVRLTFAAGRGGTRRRANTSAGSGPSGTGPSTVEPPTTSSLPVLKHNFIVYCVYLKHNAEYWGTTERGEGWDSRLLAHSAKERNEHSNDFVVFREFVRMEEWTSFKTSQEALDFEFTQVRRRMKDLGIDNVRGADVAMRDIPAAWLKSLMASIDHVCDACYKCGTAPFHKGRTCEIPQNAASLPKIEMYKYPDREVPLLDRDEVATEHATAFGCELRLMKKVVDAATKSCPASSLEKMGKHVLQAMIDLKSCVVPVLMDPSYVHLSDARLVECTHGGVGVAAILNNERLLTGRFAMWYASRRTGTPNWIVDQTVSETHFRSELEEDPGYFTVVEVEVKKEGGGGKCGACFQGGVGSRLDPLAKESLGFRCNGRIEVPIRDSYGTFRDIENSATMFYDTVIYQRETRIGLFILRTVDARDQKDAETGMDAVRVQLPLTWNFGQGEAGFEKYGLNGKLKISQVLQSDLAPVPLRERTRVVYPEFQDFGKKVLQGIEAGMVAKCKEIMANSGQDSHEVDQLMRSEGALLLVGSMALRNAYIAALETGEDAGNFTEEALRCAGWIKVDQPVDEAYAALTELQRFLIDKFCTVEASYHDRTQKLFQVAAYEVQEVEAGAKGAHARALLDLQEKVARLETALAAAQRGGGLAPPLAPPPESNADRGIRLAFARLGGEGLELKAKEVEDAVSIVREVKTVLFALKVATVDEKRGTPLDENSMWKPAGAAAEDDGAAAEGHADAGVHVAAEAGVAEAAAKELRRLEGHNLKELKRLFGSAQSSTAFALLWQWQFARAFWAAMVLVQVGVNGAAGEHFTPFGRGVGTPEVFLLNATKATVAGQLANPALLRANDKTEITILRRGYFSARVEELMNRVPNFGVNEAEHAFYNTCLEPYLQYFPTLRVDGDAAAKKVAILAASESSVLRGKVLSRCMQGRCGGFTDAHVEDGWGEVEQEERDEDSDAWCGICAVLYWQDVKDASAGVQPNQKKQTATTKRAQKKKQAAAKKQLAARRVQPTADDIEVVDDIEVAVLATAAVSAWSPGEDVHVSPRETVGSSRPSPAALSAPRRASNDSRKRARESSPEESCEESSARRHRANEVTQAATAADMRRAQVDWAAACGRRENARRSPVVFPRPPAVVATASASRLSLIVSHLSDQRARGTGSSTASDNIHHHLVPPPSRGR
jgi:hypothetical protein